MKDTQLSTPTKVGIALGAVVGLALIALFIWVFGAQFGHFAWSAIRSNVLTIIIGTIVAVVVGVIVGKLAEDAAPGIITGFIAGGIVSLITMTVIFGYAVPHKLSTHTEEQAAESVDFRQRVPHDVASAVSNRNLGDTTGDATGGVKAIPTEGENGIYTTSVVRRGMFKGYESTQTIEAPLYGSTTAQNVQFCDFSEDAKLRLGGAVPANNLAREILWQTGPTTMIDRGDALVHCEDDTPMVYVPTTQLNGDIINPIRVPGPVAVYNGQTGELKIEESLETDLPLYPQSIATAQRQSLQSSGSIWDRIFGRSGFEDTSKDEEDPNGENRSEFGLATADGSDSYFVTPLTARGSSSSIIALGTVQSDGEHQAGELRPYVVNTYEEGQSRQANSAVASRITGEVLSGYMAAGLQVFEVVPSEDGTWTATVGKEQSVLYRAVIHPDGHIDLLDSDGNQIAGEGESTGEGSPGLTTDKPIEEMTVEELKQLGDQILNELATRAGSAE